VACAAGRLDGAYWLIGPGSAILAQGCRCVLPLQAWAGAYHGGRPPTACFGGIILTTKAMAATLQHIY